MGSPLGKKEMVAVKILYSPFSLLEISIKFNLGNLGINRLSPEQFYSELENSFLNCLPIKNRDLITQISNEI